jgi:hypothetical protein
MKPLRPLGWLGGLALGAAIWFAWHEHARADALRAQLDRARQELARSHARGRELTALRTAAEARRNELVPAPTPARPPPAPVPRPRASSPAPGAASPVRVPPRASVRPWLTRVFAENPALHALYLDAFRKNVAQEHGLLMRQLGLNAAESERFVEIFTEDMERATDIGAATRAQNLSSVDAPIKALNAQRERERDEALAALLGPDRIALYTEVQNYPVSRETLNTFAATLHVTSTPLTWDQASRLGDVLRRTDALSFQQFRSGDASTLDAHYDTVIAGAASILAPQQLEVFRSLVAAHRANGQLLQLGVAASRKKTAPAPPAK